MVMRYKMLLAVTFGVLGCSFFQQSTPKRIVIKSQFNAFTADNLGNIYTVHDDELIKYLPNVKFFARYSNLKLGSISRVDVTNPLKILLYYRDFQQIVFLDNQLSVNSEVVSLENLGYEQTDLVCSGSNNSFWIYNKQNNELIRFNEKSKKIAATGNLKQVLRREMKPNFMTEYNNYLYLNCPETGIYVFDIFGAFSKIISIPNLERFQVNDNFIYFQRDSSFCTYNHVLFDERCKVVSEGSSTAMKYHNKKIFIGYPDSLVIVDFE